MNKQHRLAYIAIREVSQGKRGAVATLLKLIGVSRQAYYKGLNRTETTWEQHNVLLKKRTQYWYDFHHQGIGADNLLIALQHDDEIKFPVTIKMVRRVQRELDIHCKIRVKKRKRRKESEQHILDNILNQNFDVEAPNQVWLSDSTELTYGVNGEYKVRFSGVLDLYGRRLLSYNLSATETSAAEVQVFKQAFEVVGDVHPMVHTDRGSAFTSGFFNNFLSRHNIIRSMSRPGTPYDNAPMERWWNEFKLRWMERQPMPKTYDDLVKMVEKGIEYFNHHNRSAQRNGLTPDEYWNEAV